MIDHGAAESQIIRRGFIHNFFNVGNLGKIDMVAGSGVEVVGWGVVEVVGWGVVEVVG
jgi:hypothetical protein